MVHNYQILNVGQDNFKFSSSKNFMFKLELKFIDDFICAQEISSSQSSLQSQTADKSQNATLSQDWITKKLVPKSQDNLVSTQNVEDVDELFSSSQDNAIDEVFTSTENVSKVDYVAATYDDVPASEKVNFASLLLTEEANDDEDVTDFLMPTQEDNRVESSVRYDDVVQESMSILDEGKQLTQSTENPVEHDAQEFDHSVVSFSIIWPAQSISLYCSKLNGRRLLQVYMLCTRVSLSIATNNETSRKPSVVWDG